MGIQVIFFPERSVLCNLFFKSGSTFLFRVDIHLIFIFYLYEIHRITFSYHYCIIVCFHSLLHSKKSPLTQYEPDETVALSYDPSSWSHVTVGLTISILLF